MPLSIDVALDRFRDEYRVTQRRHMVCTRNELILTLRNMVSKNLRDASVRNSRLLTAHHERRKRELLKVFDRSGITKVRSKSSYGALRRGPEAFPRRFGQCLPGACSVAVIEEALPCLVQLSRSDISQESLRHVEVLAKVFLFARKREQGRQYWLDENGGPHELPVAQDNAHARRATVGVSNKMHRFRA